MKQILKTVAAMFMFCIPFVSIAAPQDAAHPRSISVSGTAEVQVQPDEAVLTLAIDSRDRELAIAKTQNDRRVRKLIGLAKEAGVEEKHIQTSELTMAAEHSEEKIPKFLGFKVSQTLVVELTDLSKYDTLMIKVLQAGVNRVDSLRFMVADPRKYKDEARSKALRAAREKAAAMAAELGQTIGKPLQVNEGPDFNSMCGGANVFAGYGMMLPPREDESAIASGQVHIRASVGVTFQLE